MASRRVRAQEAAGAVAAGLLCQRRLWAAAAAAVTAGTHAWFFRMAPVSVPATVMTTIRLVPATGLVGPVLLPAAREGHSFEACRVGSDCSGSCREAGG